MAKKTLNLGLILPQLGEFNDSWDAPVNANMQTIDAAVGDNSTELETGRGSEVDLNTRLSVSLNPDGSLILPSELVTARSSQIYGTIDPITGLNNTVYNHLDQTDEEICGGRQGAVSLSNGMANLSDDNIAANSILTAPPGFLNFTGATAKLDGSVTNVIANINGYRQKVRTLLSTIITGAAGTYYLTLSKTSGNQYISGSAGSTSIATAPFIQQFVDTTQNFITSGVQPGDVLSITSIGSPNLNQYYVGSVVNATTLLIVGVFQSVQTGLSYTITDPNAPSLGFTATAPAARFASIPGKIYVGKAIFDGTNITSITPFALRGVSEQWISVALVGGLFSTVVAHNLGYVPSKISVYASQANDFSVNLTPVVLERNPNTIGAMIADMNAYVINLQNTVSGVFYTDFAGNAWTTGFILVRAER
jgi:hypothetical protein